MQQSFFKSKFNNKDVLPSFWRHVTTNHKILTWWQLIMWDQVNPPQPIMKGENEQSSADCEWLEVSGSRWENDC